MVFYKVFFVVIITLLILFPHFFNSFVCFSYFSVLLIFTMRDANGTGNIYFDDFFITGMPTASIIFYSVHGSISLFNLIVVPFICYSASLNRSHHKNLRQFLKTTL